MDELDETLIGETTESVWSTVLGLDAGPAPAPAVQVNAGRYVIGCIHITGAWDGAIVLGCSEALARRTASRMFELEDARVSIDEVRDALGELTNMIGGNLKAMLPGPSRLSLPSVSDGLECSVSLPGSKLVNRVWFQCEGEPLLVSVHRRIDAS